MLIIDGIKVSSRVKDKRNKRYGRLVVFKLHKVINGVVFWWCECDCGNIVSVRSCHLSDTGKDHTTSCGCLNNERFLDRSTKHGMARRKNISAEYCSWASIKSRCCNEKNNRYYDYGGRGIVVCQRYKDFFVEFLKDVGEKPSKRYSIDRIDNDKGYTCGKCEECLENGWKMNIQWSSTEQQAKNKRSNRLIIFEGRTKTVTEWAEFYGLEYYMLLTRLNRGWNVRRALTTPKGRYIKRTHKEEVIEKFNQRNY